MTTPSVSIIVPIYNTEKYLERCINSILDQSYKNIELILVDDGSSDSSLSMCESYAAKDDRVKVFHQSNAGVSVARNKGLQNATGKYVAFVDSDDELTETAVECLVADAEKYNADVVSAVKCNVYSNGKTENLYEDGKLTVYKELEALNLCLSRDRQTNSVCAKLFKMTSLSGITFENGRNINEDGFFLFNCYAKKVVLVQHNVCIYKYYIYENSSSRSAFSEKYMDMVYFCEKKREIIERDFPSMKEKFANLEVGTNLLFLDVLLRTSDKKYKPSQKKSIKTVRKNYKYFKPKTKHEKTMGRIVCCGLYAPAKLFYRLLKKV